jgi:hypothetical protein
MTDDLSYLTTNTLVVMPTYREAANIVKALVAVRTALERATVLVVDDEGNDGTADLAEEVGLRAKAAWPAHIRRGSPGAWTGGTKSWWVWTPICPMTPARCHDCSVR